MERSTAHNQGLEEDCYLDLNRLAKRSCLSVRSLRDRLKDPLNPLPAFRLKGKVLVNWPEFKKWLQDFRYETGSFEEKIQDAVNHLTGGA